MGTKNFFEIKRGARIVSLVLSLTLCFSLWAMPAQLAFADTAALWNGGIDTSWYKAGQTEFTLNTADELAGLAKLVNDGNSFSGVTVALGQDIVLNGESSDNVWTPIGKSADSSAGTAARPFKGVFDGAGHKVSGVKVNSSLRGTGFFGYISGSAQIKNLTVEGSVVSSEISTGGIVGIIDNSTDVVVKNCVNLCSVTSGGTHAGGIVGYNSGGSMENCLNDAAVTFNGQSGNGGVGGVVGTLLGGSITKCANTAALEINASANTGNSLGGIVGSAFCSYQADVTVTDCYNRGALSSNDNDTYAGCGGIIGYAGIGSNTNYNVCVTNCYSTGALTGVGNQTGGIIGIAETDEESGTLVSGIKASNNYYLENTVNGENGGIAGSDVSGSAYNRSADNLKALLLSDCYTADKDNINDGYPVLSWQAAAEPETESLVIVSAPGKVEYTEGEFFDATGMVVEYVKGEQHTVVTDYTMTPAADTALTTDITAIEITYNNLTASQPIAVKAKAQVEQWDGTSVDTAWYDNNTAAGSYEIGTSAELAGLAKLVTEGTEVFKGKTVTLTANLDLGGHEWQGIGENSPYSSSTKSFAGTFDGNYHMIGNFTMKEDKAVGLFRGLKAGAVIKNLGVDKADFNVANSTVSYGGSVVGCMLGSGAAGALVENCRTTPNVTVAADNNSAAIGGIVGQTSGYGDTIKGCVNNASVIGGRYAGGIVGKQNAAINNCYNAGAVQCGNASTCYAGGIIGYTISQNTKIKNCYNIGSIVHPLASQSLSGAGGIACGSVGSSEFTDCYYLEGSASGLYNGKETSGINAIGKEELQAVANDLNGEQTVEYNGSEVAVWTSSANQNNGYPVLYWQKASSAGIYAVEDIYIKKAPNKTTYGEGQFFDADGMEVYVKYDNGAETAVTGYSLAPSAGTPLTTADTQIAVSFGGKTVYQPITVLAATAIEISAPPTKTSYIINEYLALAGMKVTLTYTDNSKGEITNYTATPASGTRLAKENTKVIVSYGNLTAEQPITVKTPVSIAITDAPTNAPNFIFYESNRFFTTGMKLLLTYDDGSTEVISSGFQTNPSNSTLMTKDMTSLAATYTKAGVTMTANHEITVNAITALEMTALPTKTEYKEGETFAKSGMTAKAIYADGTEKALTATDLNFVSKALTKDDTAVEVSYGSGKFSVPITVEPAVSMELKAPTKTSYKAGETLSTSGMKITLNYGDGTSKTFSSFTAFKLSLSTIVALTEADTELTVSGFGFSKSVPLTVEPAKEIAITKAPKKTEYKAGEKFQYTGMEVTVTYNDGSTLKLAYNKVSYLPMSPSLTQPLTAKDDKITITLGEATAEQPITVTSSDRVEFSTFDSYQAAPANYQLLKYFPSDESVGLYQFDGKDMLYSAKYGAYVLFVPSDLTEEQALAKITPAAGSAVTIEYKGDVNNDSKLRIDDAQLVYDLYSGWDGYRNDTAFTVVPMRSRLEADLNGDGIVDTQDALAAVKFVLYGSLQ